MSKNTIILFILSLLLSTQTSFSQDSIQIPYKNLDIVNNDDYSSFSIFENKLDSFKIIFLGENHYFRKINDEINLKFLKYLNKYNGFNTLALEFGFTRGYLVNKYIHSGDSAIIQQLKKHSGNSFIEFYEELYKFNQTLPEEKRIKVVGIDIERYMGLPVNNLCALMPEDLAPDEICVHVEALRGLAGYNDSSFDYEMGKRRFEMFSSEATLSEFIENYAQNDTIYRCWLGENFELFDTITQSLKGYVQWREYTTDRATQGYVYRENYMEKAIVDYLKKNRDAKIFAQFGRCHVAVVTQEEACTWRNYNSVAARLSKSKNTETKGKVGSIAMFYTRSPDLDQLILEGKATKLLMKLSQDDGITAFEIPDTIEMFKEYAERYDFIIFNDHKISSTVNSKGSKSHTLGFISLLYSKNSFDFKNLNEFFNAPGFLNTQNVIRLEAGVRDNHSIYGKMVFQFMISPTYSYADSLQNQLNYTAIMWYNGIDITKSRVFDIIPNYGLGFGRMKLLGTKTLNNPDPQYNPFEDITVFRYVNPAILLDLAIEMRLNLKYISIGGQAGLLLDLSVQRWRSDGKMIPNSPYTSFRNYYFACFLAWIFTD